MCIVSFSSELYIFFCLFWASFYVRDISSNVWWSLSAYSFSPVALNINMPMFSQNYIATLILSPEFWTHPLSCSVSPLGYLISIKNQHIQNGILDFLCKLSIPHFSKGQHHSSSSSGQKPWSHLWFFFFSYSQYSLHQQDHLFFKKSESERSGSKDIPVAMCTTSTQVLVSNTIAY